jgi:hypothetical protein
MAKSRQGQEPDRPKRPPATTPEARENQLVSLAVSLAEEQMRKGTASSQVITHYLKLGSTRETLEQDRLRGENELLRAKVDALASQGRIEELYSKAIKAFRTYAGRPDEDDEDQVLYRPSSNPRLQRALRVPEVEG